MSWLYLLGIALTFATGWWLRGLRDEDRATLAALKKVEMDREAHRKWVKPPKGDYPYP